MLWMTKTIKKIKVFCIKYWKALVALSLVLIGYLIGRRFDNSKIVKADLEAKDKAMKDQIDDMTVLHSVHNKKRDKLLEEKEKAIKEIEERKRDNIENLSNNEEKLDKILKEKHNLKKGE